MRDLVAMLDVLVTVLRTATLTLLVLGAALAALAWGVRTRRIQPFGTAARFVRRSVDPLLAPLDRRLPRLGVSAAAIPWWGVLATLVTGAGALFVIGFVRDVLVSVYFASNAGARGLVSLAVRGTFGVLQLALLVRVILSWTGGSWSASGRLAHRCTEWFLGPLRQALPSAGQLDLSPLIAWFLLSLLEGAVLRLL